MDGSEVIPDYIYAYLAGAMDSDGSFGIKKSTYSIRVKGDASQPNYQERCSLKQVTPEIPHLLKKIFGGTLRLEKPSTKNGKPLWSWSATTNGAANVAKCLKPYLLIKRSRADLLLELRHTHDTKYQRYAYWYLLKHPNWEEEELLSYREVQEVLGYKNIVMVNQAVRNGTLMAIDHKRNTPGAYDNKRIPKGLVEGVYLESKRSSDGRARCKPVELMEWRENLKMEIQELNRLGTGAHPISNRTGRYSESVVAEDNAYTKRVKSKQSETIK